MNKGIHDNENHIRFLLLGSGIIYVLCALLYNNFTYNLIFYNGYFLSLLPPTPPPDKTTFQDIISVRIYFLSIGIVLILISEVAKRILRVKSFKKTALLSNTLLVLISLLLPLSILELSLKPLVSHSHIVKTTTIFIPDKELEWKLRPNSEGMWGGIKVKINSKGLRGPEVDYAKHDGEYRILYLGDSVTFGYKLADYKRTFPYLIEKILEENKKENIQTINAGVGTYSPWQEYIFLSKEGIKYKPDLVIVSFILNDVTEKFTLKRFGGSGSGSKLNVSYNSLSDYLKDINIVSFLSTVSNRLRFGYDIHKGALKEEFSKVEQLIKNKDHPYIKEGWDITLGNLKKIFDFCKNRNTPVILAVFPFTFQFNNMEANSIPQKILTRYATSNNVPVIDLLPILSEKAKKEGIRPEDYFLDKDHLSYLGSETVSRIISDFIIKHDFNI